MLQDLTSVLTTAERLADRVTDLCGRGEPADNELADLGRAVAVLPTGTPVVQVLAAKVAAALAAAETAKAAVAAELEQLAARGRVSRAYGRPPP